MGIHRLWELLEPFGESIAPEALRGCRVAVDASIWLAQFRSVAKGHGEQRGILEGFLRRILKLMYYDIIPVFVFDGPAPQAKVVELRRRAEERQRGGTRLLQRHARRILCAQLAAQGLSIPHSELRKLREAPKHGSAGGASPTVRSKREDAKTRSPVGRQPRRGASWSEATADLTDAAQQSVGAALARGASMAPVERCAEELAACNLLLRKSGRRMGGAAAGHSSSLYLGPRAAVERGKGKEAGALSSVASETREGATASPPRVSAKLDSGHFRVFFCRGEAMEVEALGTPPRTSWEGHHGKDEGRQKPRCDRFGEVANENKAKGRRVVPVPVIDVDGETSVAASPRSRSLSNGEADFGETRVHGENDAAARAMGSRRNATLRAFHGFDQRGAAHDDEVRYTEPAAPPFELLDVVELLRCGGIPYIFSPSEAEAQCAWLNREGLVDVVLTEDSDVFAHGARVVVRGFFGRRSTSQCFRAAALHRAGLGVDVIRGMATLVGCDYSGGRMGVRRALELLAAGWFGGATASAVLRRLRAASRVLEDEAGASGALERAPTPERDGDVMEDLTLPQLALLIAKRRAKGSSMGASERGACGAALNLPSECSSRETIGLFAAPTVAAVLRTDVAFTGFRMDALRFFCATRELDATSLRRQMEVVGRKRVRGEECGAEQTARRGEMVDLRSFVAERQMGMPYGKASGFQENVRNPRVAAALHLLQRQQSTQ